MDINKISLEIEKLQFPLIFLFRLISYKNELSDNDFSIIIRLFLKHHITIALEINLKNLFQNELITKKSSRNVINKFYKYINKKLSLIFIIKQWYNIYDNNEFWNMNSNEQSCYLNNIKLIFLSIYDCSKGGTPLHYKIGNSINNINTIQSIKNRLEQILKMFGNKIFYKLEIPLLTEDEFDDLPKENIIKYLLFIYEKFKGLLEQTIIIFDNFNLNHDNIMNLLNPLVININMKCIDINETEFMLLDTK